MVIRIPVPGTPFSDNISFFGDDNFAFHIAAGGGNDTVTGGSLSDLIEGGTGNDAAFGADGNDLLFGQDGDDIMRGGEGSDSLSGGSGNDQLFGNNGDDSLSGSSGRDILTGGAGRDLMSGGSEADTFRFSSFTDSAVGVTRDVITDFARGSDKIDLDLIDANTSLSGNQDFFFIGSQSFIAGVTGQVRAVAAFRADGTGVTIVSGDINGDRVVDFEIQVSGTQNLSVTDFDL
jgi:Ca2+-binding RTX toxin-like protein